MSVTRPPPAVLQMQQRPEVPNRSPALYLRQFHLLNQRRLPARIAGVLRVRLGPFVRHNPVLRGAGQRETLNDVLESVRHVRPQPRRFCRGTAARRAANSVENI